MGSGEVTREEKMTLRGTYPESYITKYTTYTKMIDSGLAMERRHLTPVARGPRGLRVGSYRAYRECNGSYALQVLGSYE